MRGPRRSAGGCVGLSSPLERFAEQVGTKDAVSCAGGMTQWGEGGAPRQDAREVRAPVGIVAHQPAEMIVRVRAGTTLAALQAALGEARQQVALESDAPALATVGGLLAVGHGGPRRLGFGPPRDAVLEVTAVNAAGELIRSGAPLVKNVTGFDLCRLLVGSLGTLGFIGEVVLRCKPLGERESWWAAEGVDPFQVESALYQPLGVLWDGHRTWVGLSGYSVDLTAQYDEVLGPTFQPVDGPPEAPDGLRISLPPAALRNLTSKLGPCGWMAQVGVGVVQCREDLGGRIPPRAQSAGVVRIHERIKQRFDPSGRLNPGRSVLKATS
jgi:FAD binding domain